MKDTNPTTGIEVVQQPANSEVEFATCECCGLTEECTPAYISGVRERNQGKWICGLCTEAVKEEKGKSRIGNEEALNRHMKFCKSFKSSSPPTEELISAMKQFLLRSLDSPRTPRSSPASPMRKEGSVYSRSSSLNVRSENHYFA